MDFSLDSFLKTQENSLANPYTCILGTFIFQRILQLLQFLPPQVTIFVALLGVLHVYIYIRNSWKLNGN